MEKKHIAFYIVFPIAFLIISALLIFLYDLLNGPLFIFVLQIVTLLAFAISSFLLVKKKMGFRLIPWGALIVITSSLLSLAHPTTEPWRAVNYDNPEKTAVLRIENGDIQGVYSQDKAVEVYAGIPYAKPPIGEYRWKEPADVDNWEGVRDCSYFAAKSMQPASNPITNTLIDIYSEKGWHPDYQMHSNQNMSEDSLYLNVWKPAGAQQDLPVLVYIHGGSLTSGSSAFEEYNGESLAHHGIIMITIQYRLGVFGYFAHEDLANESPNGTTGNYGLLDQIKALDWVQNNIAYFGGDPTKVTIAGESAGSSSISALCASPLAKNKFRYAIGESSSLVLPEPPHTFRKKEVALKTGESIMKEMGCASIAELRKISADKLVTTRYPNSSMTLDGYALAKTPYQVYKDHENNEAALLNGYNIKEADAFVVPDHLFDPTNKNNFRSRLAEVQIFDDEIISKIMDLYAEKIEENAFEAFNEIISVYWFIHPHHSWSNLAYDNGIPVYRYQFTKENGYRGTYHSGEMIYCYGNVEKSRRSFAYNQSDYDLSKTMVAYWTNFVKTGNPNASGLENWEAYDPSAKKVMELGAHVGVIEDRYLGLYAIIEEAVEKASKA